MCWHYFNRLIKWLKHLFYRNSYKTVIQRLFLLFFYFYDVAYFSFLSLFLYLIFIFNNLLSVLKFLKAYPWTYWKLYWDFVENGGGGGCFSCEWFYCEVLYDVAHIFCWFYWLPGCIEGPEAFMLCWRVPSSWPSPLRLARLSSPALCKASAHSRQETQDELWSSSASAVVNEQKTLIPASAFHWSVWRCGFIFYNSSFSRTSNCWLHINALVFGMLLFIYFFSNRSDRDGLVDDAHDCILCLWPAVFVMSLQCFGKAVTFKTEEFVGVFSVNLRFLTNIIIFIYFLYQNGYSYFYCSYEPS